MEVIGRCVIFREIVEFNFVAAGIIEIKQN